LAKSARGNKLARRLGTLTPEQYGTVKDAHRKLLRL
jgi:hypothetical protein